MLARLIFAIISTLLEEAAIVVIVLWGLPQIGIHIPLVGLVAMMAGWGAYSVIIYRISSQALKRKQMVGLPDMVGSKGKVVTPLAPEGLVRIGSELWVAKSTSGEMESGEEVIVVGQDSLKLVVHERSTANDLEETE